MNMYYIATLPPADINTQVLQWKEWVKTAIRATKAMNSPGHITLVPPFRLPAEHEAELIQTLNNFAAGQHSFPVQLDDFSHFDKRTIYLKVKPSQQLTDLRENLFGFLKAGSKVIPDPEKGFSPHITIAFRDLRRADFPKAWEHFRELKCQEKFNCNSISLLRHNKKNWDVIATSQFSQ